MARRLFRHFRLLDVIGRPAGTDRFTFVPVCADFGTRAPPDLVTLNRPVAPPYALTHYLHRGFGRDIANAIRRAYGYPYLMSGTDALWVRGRLPVLFGFSPLTPGPTDDRASLLDVTFLAVRHDRHPLRAVPFVCTDWFLLTGLLFPRRPPPPPGLRRRIASAFWNLLLSAHDAVMDFDAQVLVEDPDLWEDMDHWRDSGPVRFTCRDGKFSHEWIDDWVELEGLWYS